MFKTSYSLTRSAVACALSLFLFTEVASAQSLSESFSSVDVLKKPLTSLSFNLPDFDTDLGTLESVDLKFVLNDRATVRVFNKSGTALTFTQASVTSPITIVGPLGVDYSVSLSAAMGSGLAQPGQNGYKGLKASAMGSEMINSGNFNLFEDQSGGTVAFTLSRGDNDYAGKGPERLFFGGASRQKGKVTVEYTYLVAAPEPAGKYLVAMVAAAMVLVVANRKKLVF